MLLRRIRLFYSRDVQLLSVIPAKEESAASLMKQWIPERFCCHSCENYPCEQGNKFFRNDNFFAGTGSKNLIID